MNLLNYPRMLALSCLIGANAFCSSDVISDYIGFDATIDKHRYILEKFEAPLSDADERKCILFLKQKFSQERIAARRFQQNNLADWLLKQPDHVEVTTQALLEIIYDESADLLWREFCIQKLPLAVTQSNLSLPLKEKCYQTLEQMAASSKISFSGTALLGLYRLQTSGTEMQLTETILQLAETVLKQPEFAEANKVTALQVAGLLGSEYALNYARDLIQSDAGIQLRASAIALIAKRGASEDLKNIKILNDHRDLRLRESSRAAVAQIQNRI